MKETPKLMLIGFTAGVASGVFGIGGGAVMVPLLATVVALEQHHAHATSLAAGIFLATAGGVTYAISGEYEPGIAALLAIGAIAGAPLGARVMHRMSEARLKIAFGILLVALAITMMLR